MAVAARVLFVASEAVPFVKTGGLADVVGALPEALRALGVDVRIVLPWYRSIRGRGFPVRRHEVSLEAWLGDRWQAAGLLEGMTPGGVPVYFLERDDLYDRPGLYDDGRWEYGDNLERFSFLCHGALRICEVLGFSPHVVHAHDWQAGLALALLDGPYRDSGVFQGTRRVFTIHNMGYQGLFDPGRLGATGLGSEVFHYGGVEHGGAISLLKAGIVYADAITTVSPTYAREIQGSEYGMGLDGALHYRRERLHGILNGIDASAWDPARDPHLPARFHADDLGGKRACKEALLGELGLDAAHLLDRPLVGMITRLVDQKGLDILVPVLDALVELGMGLVVLGQGDERHQRALGEAAARHPGRIGLRFGFDEGLAHRIVAGSDLFLVPSRYEPCGLTQMYALRYGTVPVVRATGGLEDSVRSYDPLGRGGTGFKFRAYHPDALLSVLREAAMLWWNRTRWQDLQRRGMAEDNSWSRSARAYLGLYASVQ